LFSQIDQTMNPFASEFVPTWGEPAPAPAAAPAPQPVVAAAPAAAPAKASSDAPVAANEEEWNEERDGPMDPELAEELARVKAEEAAELARTGGRKSSVDNTGKRGSDPNINVDLDDGEEEKSSVLSEEAKSLLDQREHVNIVFIGHVDAGKSTISGQIL
jgi:peptide chain release factor subunit 3